MAATDAEEKCEMREMGGERGEGKQRREDRDGGVESREGIEERKEEGA